MQRAQRRKFHYIYKITRFDGKYYIGMHSTDNLDDGYFGSGKRLWYSIAKYGKDQHSKEILEFLPDRESLKNREKELVCKELLEDVLCMNLVIGGDGGWSKDAAARGRLTTSLNWKDASYRREKGELISERMKSEYKNGRKIHGAAAELQPEMARRAQSLNAQKKRKETLIKIKHQQGEKNSQFGKRKAIINKDGITKRIDIHLLDDFLVLGWKRGLKEKVIKEPKIRCAPNPTKNYSPIKCARCDKLFLASQRDVRRNRKYCSIGCSNNRNSID